MSANTPLVVLLPLNGAMNSFTLSRGCGNSMKPQARACAELVEKYKKTISGGFRDISFGPKYLFESECRG